LNEVKTKEKTPHEATFGSRTLWLGMSLCGICREQAEADKNPLSE
jgi:hypothetical protein